MMFTDLCSALNHLTAYGSPSTRCNNRQATHGHQTMSESLSLRRSDRAPMRKIASGSPETCGPSARQALLRARECMAYDYALRLLGLLCTQEGKPVGKHKRADSPSCCVLNPQRARSTDPRSTALQARPPQCMTDQPASAAVGSGSS